MSDDPTPEPAEIEATGQKTITITLSFDDVVEDFEVPASADDWPFSFTVAYDAGKVSEAVKSLLGQEQFDRLVKANPTISKVNEFVEAYMGRLGLVAGE